MVRPATDGDLPALCRLMQHVQAIHAEAHPEIFVAELDRGLAAAFFATVLTKDSNIVLVAEAGGAVVGYVWCEDRPGAGSIYAYAAHTGYIHHVSVDPGHRRSGVGRALVAAALSTLKARGATRVGVDHWTFNRPARAFFAGLGFEPEREIRSKALG